MDSSSYRDGSIFRESHAAEFSENSKKTNAKCVKMRPYGFSFAGHLLACLWGLKQHQGFSFAGYLLACLWGLKQYQGWLNVKKCARMDFIRGPFVGMFVGFKAASGIFIRRPFVGMFVGFKAVLGMAKRIFKKNALEPPFPILLLCLQGFIIFKVHWFCFQ